MFCPECGKINPDNNTECSGCGALLKEEPSPTKKSSKGKVWKAVAVLVIVAVIVAIVLVLNGCSAPEKDMSF